MTDLGDKELEDFGGSTGFINPEQEDDTHQERSAYFSDGEDKRKSPT